MKKDVKVIKDIDAIKVGVEKTRSKIVALLKIKDMTISQLAEALERDQSTIYRHIKKLEEYDFLEVTGERKLHHIPEKLYGRTAAVFLFSPFIDEVEDAFFGIPKWEIESSGWVVETLKTLDIYDGSSQDLLDELSYIFTILSKRTEDRLFESENNIRDMSYTRLLRLAFVLFLLELDMDDELKERTFSMISNIKHDR